MTPSDQIPNMPELPPQPVPEQPDPAEVLRKRVYMGFAAIVALGMAIAGLYITGRLFAYTKAPKAVANVVQPAAKPIRAPGLPKPSPLQPAKQAQAVTKPAPAAVQVAAVEKALEKPAPVPPPTPVP